MILRKEGGSEPKAAKFAPMSDFSVVYNPINGVTIPVFICEVVSDALGSDRWRMLCQALVLIRQINMYLKLPVGHNLFVLNAVYITKRLHAHWYQVVSRRKGSGETAKVGTHT